MTDSETEAHLGSVAAFYLLIELAAHLCASEVCYDLEAMIICFELQSAVRSASKYPALVVVLHDDVIHVGLIECSASYLLIYLDAVLFAELVRLVERRCIALDDVAVLSLVGYADLHVSVGSALPELVVYGLTHFSYLLRCNIRP